MNVASSQGNRRVHMANEHPFLAWVRTSIAIMAFGFVVEKFALFMRSLSTLLCKVGSAEAQAPPSAPAPHSSWLGVALVGLGAVMGVLAFVRYKKVERQIDEGSYRPSVLLDTLLAMAVACVGVFLIILLSHTIL